RGVHAAAPQLDPVDTVLVHLAACGLGGGEVHVAAVVHVAQQLPGGVLEEGHAVAGRIAGHVGLVDGDGGEGELLRGDRGASAQRHRGGEVDHVGPDLLHASAQGGGGGGGDAHIAVAGHGRGGDGVDVHLLAAGGAHGPLGAGARRGDDLELVTGGGEMIRHAEHGAGDAVEVRECRFRDQKDPHALEHAPPPGPAGHGELTSRC